MNSEDVIIDEEFVYAVLERIFYKNLENWDGTRDLTRIGVITYNRVFSSLERRGLLIPGIELSDLFEKLFRRGRIETKGRMKDGTYIWSIKLGEKHYEEIEKKKEQVLSTRLE